jgi:hypothetical protein
MCIHSGQHVLQDIGSGLLAASNVTRQERVGFANW